MASVLTNRKHPKSITDELTYEAIGRACGLEDETLQRYMEYMIKRWGHEEWMQCLSGYATEWALKFKDGIEAKTSDGAGKYLLDIMKKEAELKQPFSNNGDTITFR